MIKDSYKRTKRQSRSSSQAPPSAASLGNGEARLARLILQHSRTLAAEDNREFQGDSLPSMHSRVMAAFAPAAAREEEKEEDGTVENRETGLGTVVA